MSGMALTPGDGPNRNPVPRNDQRAPDVYVNGRGSRTLVPSRPVSPGQQGQQQPGQYPGQRPGERPGQGQGPGYGSGPHGLPGGYGDGRDPYGQGGYGDQGYGGQNGYDGRNGWDGRNGYDGRNGQPGQQGRNGSGRDRDDAPKRKKKQQSSAKRRKQLGQRPAHQGAADGAQAGQRRPGRDGPARHHRHRVRVDRLHRQLVLRRLLPPRQRERDSQDGRGPVPADRHAADRVRDGVPAEPGSGSSTGRARTTGPPAAAWTSTSTPSARR